MKNIDLITQYLLNTDEDFNEKFEFLTDGLKKEEKETLRSKFKDKFQGLGKSKIKKIEKGVITVFGDSEFASEFSFILSKKLKKRVMVIDADRLNPMVDVHLNIRKYNNKFVNKIKYNSQSGFGLAMDIINKGMMSKDLLGEVAVKKRGHDALYFIHGDDEIDNYEYYNNEGLKKLIDIARENYDFCILSVNDFIYDAYTCIALMQSDLVMMPCQKNLVAMKTCNRYIDFLCRKQDVSREKIKYIGFHTEKSCGLDRDVLEALTGNKYMGEISYSLKRSKCRNMKRSFSAIMPRKIRNEYVTLYGKLGIS